ncbi:MAG: glucose-1-phosphate thymidylyltransferase, partial [Candidatus Verstraetearchaeota archaeon]|nr:glucose-1-phosphate thymidylyltransferase [Candidatus Verstraetearchaeota archaeon]
VHHHAEVIEEFLRQLSMNMEIVTCRQSSPLGTAHALQAAESYLCSEYFLAVYGDLAILPQAFQLMFSSFKPGMGAVLGAVEVPDVSQFGEVVHRDFKLVRIDEKPREAKPGLINAGVYIFSQDIFKYIRETPLSPREEYELTSSLELMTKDHQVSVVVLDKSSWIDVGRPWDILEANEMYLKHLLKEQTVLGEIEEGATLKGPIYVGKGAVVRSGSYIEGPVWIGDGSDIGPNCYIRPYTYLGKKVRVGNACEIKDSILMDYTHVGHLSYVGDSVIGERCNLGAGTLVANLRFDDMPVKITVKGKKVSSSRRKLGVFLGDCVKTGINVSFIPGAIVGPNSWIAPHTLVERDIPENTLVFMKGYSLEFKPLNPS